MNAKAGSGLPSVARQLSVASSAVRWMQAQLAMRALLSGWLAARASCSVPSFRPSVPVSAASSMVWPSDRRSASGALAMGVSTRLASCPLAETFPKMSTED
jgi:hypothetical protein